MLTMLGGMGWATTVKASDILWSSAAGSAWLTAASWAGGAVPTAIDNAQVGANPTSGTTGLGINGNGLLVPGSQIQDVGAIEVTSARNNLNLLIGNSTTTAAKDMTLALKGTTVNGVANTILRNNGSGTTTLTLQDTQGSGTKTMGVRISNSAAVIDAVSPIVISSILSSSTAGYGFTKTGAGVLTLSGANTLNGDMTVNAGTLKLTTGGTIASVPNVILASGTTLDVSTLTAALTLANSQGLKSSASASTATIITANGKGLTTGASSPIQFTAYDGSTTPLTLSGAGTLTLQSGNPVTVTVTGGALGGGDYKLIAKGASGTVSGTPTSVTVNGSGLAGGATASLQIIGGELFLHVVSSGTPKITVTLPGEVSANAGGATAQTAGTAFNISLTATTDGMTTDTSYSGVTNITFSGPTGSPTYPATVDFSSGVGTANITLTKVETTTITATDGTITGTASSSLLINPGAIASYTVAASSPQTVGIAFNVAVTAKDANDNIVTTDSSTSVTMGSGSGNVSFATNPKTLSSGMFTVSATDNTAETTTITANDGAKNGTSGNIVVNMIPKYRSKQSGNWGDFTSWQVDTTGGGFVDATTGQTPTTADDTVEIQNTHTVTVAAPVSVDQVTVDAGGQITISGVVLTLANGSGTDLIINGTVLNSGTFTVSSGATWALNAGGTFVYNTTTGLSTPLNSAAIDPASMIVYRGSSTLNPTPSISARTNGNVLFESTSGAYAPASTSGGNPWTINGNLLIGATGAGTVSYNTTGFTGAITNAGNLVIGGGSTLTIGTSGYTLKGNLTNDGTLTLSSGSFTFDGTATIAGTSSVSFANGFTIGATRTVKLAQSINIPSGKIGTVNGTLAGTGAITGSGSVTVSATGTLSPGSSIGTLTFATPPTLSGATVMEIDRNGGSPLSDKIVLSSGQLDYGGTLTVVNIGSALQLNDTFTLFAADTLFGSFATVTLPTLPTGLSWDISQLAVDGTITVTCDGTLLASAGPAQQICFGNSTAIGGGPTASGGSGSGYTYSWSPGTGLSSDTAANPIATPTSTTTYTVTATDANGCTAQSPVLVTVNPLPTVSVNSATICAGVSTTLTATTDASGPSFLWSPGGATTSSINVSPSSTTIYSVTVTDGTTGCANSASATVTVNPLPTVTIAPATTNVECAGAVTFTADPAGDGPLTYQWYDNLTNAIPSETNVTLTLSDLHDTAAGNYTIVVTGPFCSASTVTSLTVVDTTAPVITLNGADPATNECHMAYTDAGATASDACAGNVGVSVNNLVDANVPGIYTVTYTADDGNGHTNTSTRTVYVVDTIGPVITLNGANPLTVQCHDSFVDPGETAADACAGSVSVALSGSMDANTPGSYLLTYTAGDGNGNTNSVTRTVNVVDTVGPMIVILGANPATNECHVAYADSGATANDACAGNVVLSTNGIVDASLPGVYVVTYTSDDGNGNTNVATRTVYVVDTVGPVIAILGENPATNECHVAYADSGATANDACAGDVNVSTNSSVDANVPGVYTITYVSGDGSGNTNSATRTVYVVDTLAPTLAILGANPKTNECHAPYLDAGATAADACAGNVGVSTNNPVDANVPGVYTVVYTSDDGNGNTNTATRTVYVADTVGPMIVILGANPATNECHVAYADSGATANDACAGNVVLSTNGTVDANVPGVYLVTYTSDDGNGNTNVATRTIYVMDTLPPVIVCTPNKTVECGSLWSFDGPEVLDACGGTNVTLVVLETITNANVLTRTWAASDPAGNTNTCSQSVTVAGTAAPVITLLGANPATNECHAAYIDAGATASDACAGDVGVSTNNTVDANTPGVYSVTYTDDDGDGHTNTATRTVYVVDTTAPLIMYYFTNLTLSANSSCQALMPDVTGTNYILAEEVCGAITITQTPTNNALLNLGTTEVVLAVADSTGHTVSSTNTIIVVDTTLPVITLNGANPLTVECHGTFADPGASASDNCSGIVAATTNGVVNVDVPGSYTIEYSAADTAGNSVTNARIVNVLDTIAPVITLNGANPLVVECHSGFSDPGATAADACAGPVGVALSGSVDADTPGSYTLTYTAGDGNGNTNNVTRTVNVVDTVAPALTILGANPTTNECHVPFVDAGATASDVCAGPVDVATNSLVNANVPGVYAVTYTSDDGKGNTNTATRTVYVADTVAPMITILGANPATNECHVTYVDAGATASDACAGAVSASTNSTVDANTPGVYSVTYTSDDGNGNTNTVTRTVYVVDTLPPMIVLCATNRTMVVGGNCMIALPDFTGELTASDSCSAVTVSQSPLPGTEVGVGQLLVTFTASDAANNNSTCTMLLNVTTPANANTNISISEFMAKNTTGITDEYDSHSDWIEVHNAGTCPVNLDGWSLTDDAALPTKWSFPATNIAAGQFLVIWASDRNLRTPGTPLHTNFKLSDTGEYLALVQPNGVTIATQFAPTFPAQLPDVSYGLPADGVTNTFLSWPTPGSLNSPGTNFSGGTTNIIISEFMAKNSFTLADENGTFSDWIEIYNAGCCPVNLNNWALTDDPTKLTKWRFPATNIAAGQFIVVWASDKNRRTPGSPLHTNFKMGDEGEYLALVQPDGVSIATQFYPTFPPQLPDVSYGMPADSITNNYLAWPTPGLPNSPGTNFVIANLEFNPGRGWFTNLVSVAIGSPTPGVTVYFTTNGTVPSPTNGFVYSNPLVFSNTTVLRAAAYRPAYVPSVVTHTYVFPTMVANQTGSGFPTNWGFTELGVVPTYYTCNSNLVNDPRWGNQIPAALLSLPTLSVVMSPDDMFGTNGIYSNPFGDGVEWERPCSAEYFRPDAKPGFQINCGIRIHGQLSRDPTYTPKHSLRLVFKQMYGSAKLSFNLYPGSPVQDFNVLVLHASLSDHWHGIGALAQMQRDQWSADTQQETGGYGTHGDYVNLYINGLYWGMYNVGERPDADYAAQYLGGNKSDYDALHGNDLMDGTTNAWNELINIAEAGITNDVAWSNVCYYLDVPQFIDYLLINFYAINTEWLDHNWWIEGSVTHGVPFHFFSWDAEDGIGGSRSTTPINYDVIGLAETVSTWPGVLYSSLHQHPEFRRLFGDHAQRLLFNRGALTPERASARWMKRAQEVDSAITAETVRWGITNWWATSVWGADWELNTHDNWLAEQTYLMTDWFPQRTDILIAQLRNAGLYPSLNAPVFTPHGGIIVESLPVTITTPTGTILYCTTNGTDPRLPDGSASPDALVFDQGTTFTLTLTNSSHLLARAFATNTWSALVEAEYPRSDAVELRIENITRRSNGTVKLDFLAWPGASYTLRAAPNLESSTSNLTNWEAVATVVPFPNGTFNFVDTAATNHPVRFYRLTWP